jgi:uncharacterized membrane protein YjgN (DUF898 family)
MHDETMASGVYLPEIDVAPARPASQGRHLQFRGNARDYFRIWIVNIALSLVTLGIYSAWATVRTRRYMYSNTTLADTPFEYLAKPLPILKGRLLTAALFATYALGGQFYKPAQAVALLIIGAFMPWMIVKSLMFRARYSSWRGLRFYFTDDFGGAYKWYLGVYFLMGIPLTAMGACMMTGHPVVGFLFGFGGIVGLAPWIKGHQQEWMVENHHFGGKSFKFSAEISSYYGIYLKTAATAFAWALPTAALIGLVFYTLKSQLGIQPRMAPPLAAIAAIYACMAPFYLGVWTFTHTQMTNLLYNSARLGSYRFRSTLGYWEMFSLYLTNGLAVLCTIGLAIPWARIRLARYRASHLEIVGTGDLNDFVRDAFAHGEIGATATEMDSLLGIDIGL